MPPKKRAVVVDDDPTVNAAQEELLQDALLEEADGLEIMLEIIMMIREDDDFAKSIYANCPRLQHMLERNPDLRPLFEEPKLVALNFEQVYRNAGGVLPGDEPSFLARTLKCIVNHPLFKVLRLLLLVKKLYTCILGGGVSFLRSCLCSFFADDGLDPDLLDGDDDDRRNGYDDDDRNRFENNPDRKALYDAAERMEEPEMQDKMHKILHSDPDKLSEAIEADPELRALRDSNPLCAELMKEPETMKILTEPDNLRAFADSPSLVEADFTDSNWSPPDVEEGVYDDTNDTSRYRGVGSNNNTGFFEDYEQGELHTDEAGGGLFDDYERGDIGGGDDDGGGIFDDYERGDIGGGDDDDGGIFDDFETGEHEGGHDIDDDGFLDDFETGEHEGYDLDDTDGGGDGYDLDNTEGDGEYDLDDTDVGDEDYRALRADGSHDLDDGGHDLDDAIEDETDFDDGDADGKKTNQRKSKKEKENKEGSEGGEGGGGFYKSLGAGLLDYVAAETIGMSASAAFGGGDDGLDGLVDGAAEDLEGQADNARNFAEQAALVAEVAASDDIAGNVESTLDTVDEAHDSSATTAPQQRQTSRPIDLDDAIDAGRPRPGLPVAAGAGVVAAGSRFFSSLGTAAKEYVASTVLGDDLGESLVERIEEGGDDDVETGGAGANDNTTQKVSNTARNVSRKRGSQKTIIDGYEM